MTLRCSILLGWLLASGVASAPLPVSADQIETGPIEAEPVAPGPTLAGPAPEGASDTTPDDGFTPGTAILPGSPGHDWWSSQVGQPTRPDARSLPISLDQLAIETLSHSYQVAALAVGPRIRRTQVTQADAEFDATAFVDARWFDRDEPVGSFLATGGLPRLLEETLTENIGVRRRTRTGASVEVAQQMIYQESNSTFFIPNNQAQTRLSISVSQPLLRGSGRVFNESIIVLAQHDVRIADSRFAEGLQEQLLRVARQYWQLYLQRSLVLVHGRNLERARSILAELEQRAAIDALRSQIERAKAKVATRQASWLRAKASVRNAEARLRSLVNSPGLGEGAAAVELTPLDFPSDQYVSISLPLAKQLALAQRPELDTMLTQIRAASVRLNVAHRQILPSLALVVESYLSGLQGQYQLAQAYGDQFSKGAPSYTAGLVFEMPLGNRRACAQLRQRQLELSRYYRQLDALMAELAAEVEIALREVDITHTELSSRRTSLAATATEVEYLYQRWRRLPGHDRSSSLLLDDLLDAEDRLVAEEEQVATALANFAIAQVELKRSLGELVTSQPVKCEQQPAATLPLAEE